jgi:hypothetical protein
MMAELPPGQPLWMVPQAFGGEQHWDRWVRADAVHGVCSHTLTCQRRCRPCRQPTAREVRVMTYTSVIGGARGIQYFLLGALLPEYNQVREKPDPHQHRKRALRERVPMCPFPSLCVCVCVCVCVKELMRSGGIACCKGVHFEPHDALWSECRRLALELADLAPALLTMDARVPVRVLAPTALVEAAAYYEAGRGTVTVLVVNLDVQPKVLQLAVDLPRAPATGSASVLFEQRTVPVSAAGEVSDLIDGWGTRVYRMVVAPAAAMVAQAKEDNLVLNPSFELQSSVGRVDSYLATYGLGGSVVADPW